MSAFNVFRRSACLSALCTVVLFANSAMALTTYYFDVDGTTAGFGITTGNTYDWDDTTNGGFWDTSNAGTGPVSGWTQMQFPKFGNGAVSPVLTYTVNVSNNEQVAGMFNSTAGTDLTINATGSGGLEFVGGGNQGIINSAGSNFRINAPIVGSGTVVNPNNGGNVYLYGNNTYTGGTFLNSTATLVYFNKSSSFGTGTITIGTNSAAGFAPMLGTGAASITLANNFKINYPATGTAANVAGINFAADAATPVVSSGNWDLGANAATTFKLRNNGVGSSPLTLSGVISGAGSIELSSNAVGSTVYLGGANTYTGKTTITGPGGGLTPGTAQVDLVLNAANTIASSSSVVMAGGYLDPNGYVHSMPNTTLGLTTSTPTSVIDYSFSPSGAELDFANSSALTWTGNLLDLKGWNPALDKLRIGTDATGLTPAQLAKIEFSESGLGTAVIDPNGYVHPYFGASAGDYNKNASVGAGDFTSWRKAPGSFGTDPNGYDDWRENFGDTTSTPAPGPGLAGAALVPEPAGFVLLLLGFGAMSGWRRGTKS